MFVTQNCTCLQEFNLRLKSSKKPDRNILFLLRIGITSYLLHYHLPRVDLLLFRRDPRVSHFTNTDAVPCIIIIISFILHYRERERGKCQFRFKTEMLCLFYCSNSTLYITRFFFYVCIILAFKKRRNCEFSCERNEHRKQKVMQFNACLFKRMLIMAVRIMQNVQYTYIKNTTRLYKKEKQSTLHRREIFFGLLLRSGVSPMVGNTMYYH